MLPEHSHSQMGHTVGANLRAARLAKKYTQSQLASPDFSVSYISAIERGQIHPSLRALEILARRLNLSSTDLLPERSLSLNDTRLSDKGSLASEDEVDVLLLYGHLAILQEHFAEAITLLDQLVPEKLSPRKQLQRAYLLGLAYCSSGQLQQSEHMLTEAKQLSIEHTFSFMQARILHVLAMLHGALYNHAQALQIHQECLQLIQDSEPDDPFFLSQIYTQLGIHHMHMDNLDSAIDMLQQAVALSEQLTDISYVQAAYWKLSQFYAKADEKELAAIYAYKCLHIHNQYVAPLKREIYHHLGRAMMKRNAEEAHTYLEQALKQENLQQDQLIMASITTYMAEWYFMHKDIASAESSSQEAYQLVLPFGDTIMAVEVLLLRGRIAYAQSHYEEGDTCFVDGLTMLERLRIMDELSDQSVAYAQLLEERGKEREALNYYRQAFEKRQRVEMHRG